MNDQWRREVHAVHISEQEIRHAESSTSGINPVGLQLPLGRPKIKKVVGALEKLIAELKAMASLQPTKVINDVPGLRNLILRTPRRRSDARKAVDFDRGQSTGARSVRDSSQADKRAGLGRAKSYDNGITMSVITAESEPRIVDQRVRQS